MNIEVLQRAKQLEFELGRVKRLLDHLEHGCVQISVYNSKECWSHRSVVEALENNGHMLESMTTMLLKQFLLQQIQEKRGELDQL